MTDIYAKETGNDELWQTIFEKGHPDLCAQHRFHERLPKDPRCRLCKTPFAGIGGMYMRFRGKKVSSRNHHYCNACDGFLDTFPGGAEVELSVMFADIRNSTAYAEASSPQDVSTRINRFLDAATATITDGDGFIMAFYGDCIVAVWPPGFSGEDHAAKALKTAQAVAKQTQQGSDPIPVGVGVHTGKVYIGTVQAAQGLFRDVSIFGVNVNLAARLAAAAAAGEVMASVPILKQAQAPTPTEDIQNLDLKGISDPVPAIALNG